MIHEFQQQPGVRDTCTCGLLAQHPDHGEEWKPTAENVNALPFGIRRYIHHLETNADPAGTIAEAIVQRDNALALAQRVKELEAVNAKLLRVLDRIVMEFRSDPMISRWIVEILDEINAEAQEPHQ